MSGISRDQGLKRISRVTRWIGAGGIACAGLFAALAAKAQPGRTTVSTPAVTTPAAATGSSGSTSPVFTPPRDSQAEGGVSAPAQAAQPARGRSDSVSRGS